LDSTRVDINKLTRLVGDYLVDVRIVEVPDSGSNTLIGKTAQSARNDIVSDLLDLNALFRAAAPAVGVNPCTGGFSKPSPRKIASGIVCPLIGKMSTARCKEAAYSASFGTDIQTSSPLQFLSGPTAGNGWCAKNNSALAISAAGKR
jgi:hypothetical protein